MKKILVLVIALLFTGCTPKVTHNVVSIEHKLGVAEVQENPKKIAVFDMGIVDIFNGVGIEIGAVPKASLPVSLSVFDNDSIVDAGTLFEPDFEALAMYEPDLIIISGRASKNYDTLSEIAPTVFLGTGTHEAGLLASIEENIKDLEVIFPQTDFRTKFNDVKQSVDKLHDKATATNLNTMFLLANGGTISSYGPGSRYDHVFNEFGFKAISETFEDSTHGDKLSFELVAKMNPEILIILDRGAVTGSDVLAYELLNNEFIQSSDAYKENRIIFVDPQTWYLTEGGLEALNSATKELLNSLD